MKILQIENNEQSYKMYIDNDISKINLAIAEHKIKLSEKFFLITDSKVYGLYGEAVKKSFKDLNYLIYHFPCGEKNKNFNTISDIYSFLIRNNADNNSILIAFGGGTVIDMVGFAAATYMSGIRYINIPTTLVSQTDGCIGGKVAYNSFNIKNLIGTFYDPIFVYVSVNLLHTLPENGLSDGLAEVIKYGITSNEALINFVTENNKHILEYETDKLFHIVKECLKIKSEIIKIDYRNIGIRNVLSFGHTVGHGIEVDSGYKMSHGFAVALGMLVSIKLSEEKLGLPEYIYKSIESIYNKVGLPINYKIQNYGTFYYSIRHDKNNSNGIRFVLLENIGKCKIKFKVEENEIHRALIESISK